MFITWDGKPVVHDASDVPARLADHSSGDDADLIAVDRSYGAIRGGSIPGDPEHWSVNGA